MSASKSSIARNKIVLHAATILIALMAWLALPNSASAELGTLYTNTETGHQYWKADGANGLDQIGANFNCRGGTTRITTCLMLADTLGKLDIEHGVSHTDARLKDNPTDFYNETDGTLSDSHEGRMSTALFLFDVAAGANGKNSCVTCDFITFFMIALNDFSRAVYDYFFTAFKVITPILMTIWLGYRVSKLAVMGGEDGKAFIYQVVAKLALFSLIWMIVTATVSASNRNDPDYTGNHSSNKWFWTVTGPSYLEFAFDLSTEIRNSVLTGTVAKSPGRAAPLNCDGVRPAASKQMAEDSNLSFLTPGIQIACVTERTHILGIASGVGVITTSVNGVGGAGNVLIDGASAIVGGIVKAATGALMIAVYGLSAVWLIFLLLDVVVRSMMTAAFAPVLATLYIFQPTRGIAVGGIKALAGALVTAMAISIVSVLGYFLMTNTVNVYEEFYEQAAQAFENKNIVSIRTGYGGAPDSDRLAQFRTFIDRVQQSDPDAPFIPMDFNSPWLYYMIMSGLATFALGKKIIAMLEEMIGVNRMSAMADNALKLTERGVMAGFGGAMLAGGVVGKLGGVMVGPGAAIATGAVGGAAAATQALRPQSAAHNVFGVAKLGSEMSKKVFDAAQPDETP